MLEYLRALGDPAVPFLRYALLAGVLSSAAFGVVGSYVTVKRIGSMAGAIAHSVLAGVGIALFLKHARGIEWLHPLMGAVIAAVVAAVIIGLVNMYARQREDTVIAAIWSVGMAVGILFLARTPGYVNPMTYLFGNVLIVAREDLIGIAVLDALVVTVGVLLYPKLQAVAFDEEFARVRGVRTRLHYITLLVLAAVTIVLLTSIVGVILVIALLTLPAGIAGLFSRKLWQMMIGATALTALFILSGMATSYVADLPSGSTIVVIAGGVYLITMGLRAAVRRIIRHRFAEQSVRRSDPTA
jgi:zinc transport system permease protein